MIYDLLVRKVALSSYRVAVLFLLLSSSKNAYLVILLLIISFFQWNLYRPSKTLIDGIIWIPYNRSIFLCC